MRYTPIAILHVPAVGSPTGWFRSAKTIYISAYTPAWLVRIIDEWGGV